MKDINIIFKGVNLFYNTKNSCIDTLYRKKTLFFCYKVITHKSHLLQEN